MKKVKRIVYAYKTSCYLCDANLKIYYTIADFGDAPIIKKCKYCNELYWYTLEDEVYIQPIDKQLDGKKCVNCKHDLIHSLVSTHTSIQCCDTEFSLDDDFAGNNIPPSSEMEQIEVYLIYS